ncbi:hypothetical protein TSAR_012943 [Trichomalopsis sarcophagae]|uniref:Uncharacterized protein n=1 Tax=Trichomalopsis sarcophagae TaxID=543379 RepID=A0A232FFL2_9HYME|nr:hypothetical protein TSAR_012943 [Trichomalopsis sarcophagae]
MQCSDGVTSTPRLRKITRSLSRSAIAAVAASLTLIASRLWRPFERSLFHRTKRKDSRGENEDDHMRAYVYSKNNENKKIYKRDGG